ncbi:AraC family transcriptional regulator [Microbulbifer sp. 2201CG32-9]|uniref:AraC family transcriptional regulator n=1 Tax=Microbulbifer sp. 2201CG32-9 TaxID=3232309 RepID=UPI00345C5067
MNAFDRVKPETVPAELESARQKLVRIILRQAPQPGRTETGLDGLILIRSNGPATCTSSVIAPSLSFIIQGSRTLGLGDREATYMPLSYVATSVHLPLVGRVEFASEETPFLTVRMTIDPKEVADLVLELGDKAPGLETDIHCTEVSCGFSVAQMNQDLLDAVIRLVDLAENPVDARILAPLVRREIVYRALMGEIGVHMRKFAMADSQANRVSRVVEVLKDRFAESLRISDLAEQANMSESSLYHSFKQITRMSPLQFQKRLRLNEARRLMLSEGLEAASASYRVGYESPSHFSREYSRMFGLPPRADVSKLRDEWQLPA